MIHWSCPALLLAFMVSLPVRASELPLRAFERVAIAPMKTSIYVGTVSLTLPALARTNGVYDADYAATVFPFFFYNEQGRLSVELSDDMLRTLERGEPVEFTGRAVRDNGETRRIEGKATPENPAGGKLKVRVFYSKRIELIFNTSYRFPDAQASRAAASDSL
jgi:hypothetical protein